VKDLDVKSLEETGFSVVRLSEAWSTTPAALRDQAQASPFAFVTRLLGTEPLLVERQPIRPLPDGRSFASSRDDTPLHTDSQMFLGVPAAVQILVCVTPAARGGESLFVDGARLLDRLDREAPDVGRALLEVDRLQRFYFGDVVGPTVARRGGHLVWTVAPPRDDQDSLGARLHRELAREPVIRHRLAPGEAIVASNHRMVHGRTPFEGERELVRLLVWLEQPLPADPRHLARSRELEAPLGPVVAARLRAVLGLLRGVPPAKIAATARVPEATLYAWRDAFTRGGLGALATSPPPLRA